MKNVGTVLDNNPELTMACINLAMHSAITIDKTYLANKESSQQKFIGYGCLSSSRAAEFFQRIGNEQTLSLKMAKACVTHLEDGEIPALDGTRVDCNSANISLAAVGKKKDGSYGPQINVSLVINAKTAARFAIEPIQATFPISVHWMISARCVRTSGFPKSRL